MLLTTAVFELRLQGIAVRFDADWELTATVLHGAFLRHRPSALTMHLRDWARCGDAAWLRDELFAQNWVRPPTDVRERAAGDHRLIGGTFRSNEPGQLVREWFLSNGRGAANACLPFLDTTPGDQLAPFEQLLDTVTFLAP